jgi:glycerol-3-phosphate dehydrogenase (NAD(P)+)
MRISYLGTGTWGVVLSSLLASKGHEVVCWSIAKDLVDELQSTHQHPNLPGVQLDKSLVFTDDLDFCLEGTQVIVESVTSQGIRPVFETLKEKNIPKVPIIITSKGLDKKTGFLLPELALQILGDDYKDCIGCISGPSHAEEVAKQQPTSVVSSSFGKDVRFFAAELFGTSRFRVYPNKDIQGVCFGGAMKNIIAIACGISDGLGLGDNTKAALMTRGLHEIRKLSVAKDCSTDTLNGLSGMGDLCVTCLSTLSRNYCFGRLLSEGKSGQEAQEEIKMVVEGVYSCDSAVELSRQHQIPIPITQSIYQIVYEGLNPEEAVISLMTREVKEEHL